MVKYEIAYWGNVFDELISELAPLAVLQLFREKYGSAVIDVCGVRLVKDGAIL